VLFKLVEDEVKDVKFLKFLLLGAILAMAGACSKKVSYNTKMTITVEIGGIEYSGHGVVKGTREHFRIFSNRFAAGPSDSVFGEAVIIDAKEHGYIFALWKGRERVDSPRFHRPLWIVGLDNMPLHEECGKSSNRLKCSIGTAQNYKTSNYYENLSEDRFPYLVRFADLGDPSSFEVFLPEEMESIFGDGAHMVGATVEATREKVSSPHVLDLMPWLAESRFQRIASHERRAMSSQERSEVAKKINLYKDLYFRHSK